MELLLFNYEVEMEYRLLNEKNKNRMKGICNNQIQFAWEDREMLDILMGKLPVIHWYNNDKVKEEIGQFNRLYSQYEFPIDDKTIFIQGLEDIVNLIQEKDRYMNVPSLEIIEKTINWHNLCVISGEGGIGKSYFIKKLEERLSAQKIEHLCIYGKFEKDVSRIDFDQIVEIGKTKVFVFVVDALNEMIEEEQEKLLEKVDEIKSERNIRVVFTFRKGTLTEKIQLTCEKMAGGEAIPQPALQ